MCLGIIPDYGRSYSNLFITVFRNELLIERCLFLRISEYVCQIIWVSQEAGVVILKSFKFFPSSTYILKNDFLLLRSPSYIISNRLIKSVSMRSSIGNFTVNYSCLRKASTSSDIAANAMNLSDMVQRSMHLNSYDLYSVVINLVVCSGNRIMCTHCENEWTWLENALSLYTKIWYEFTSSFYMRMAALLSWPYLITFESFTLPKCAHSVHKVINLCNIRYLER